MRITGNEVLAEKKLGGALFVYHGIFNAIYIHVRNMRNFDIALESPFCVGGLQNGGRRLSMCLGTISS
jgi:hypothetical protein